MREDTGYYAHWPYRDRPKIKWPGGDRVAFWVAPNIEFYELDPPETRRARRGHTRIRRCRATPSVTTATASATCGR